MRQQLVGRHLAIRSLIVFVLSAALFSFAERPGGDTFSIYLNDKLLLQQHVWMERGINELSLTGRHVSDILKIQYSHCGKTGTARAIAVLNGQDKTMKTWRFRDDHQVGMELNVGELMTLQRTSGQGLHLVYTSTEIPEGKTLINIANSDGPRAGLH